MSILSDIREFCVGDATSTAFDKELKIHANAAFGILNQAGIGPEEKFKVTDTNNWSEFTGPGVELDMVEEYICLKVKSIFDPGTSRTLQDAADRELDEAIYRMNLRSETGGNT